MMEANLTICRTCQQKKLRIKVGKFGTTKDNKYRDEWGNLWNAKQCPECNKERVKNTMRKLRASKNQPN